MRTFLIIGCFLLVIGCDSGTKVFDVTGKISLDGVPVEKGDITFRAENSSTPPQGSNIKEGTYKIKANEGKYKVEITATRLVPGKKGPMGEPAIEEFIPAKYNTKTTLGADVKNNAKNEINFDLSAK